MDRKNVLLLNRPPGPQERQSRRGMEGAGVLILSLGWCACECRTASRKILLNWDSVGDIPTFHYE